MNSRATLTKFADLDGATVIATANRVLPPVVSVILVIIVGWQLAKLIWLLMPGTAAGLAVSAPASASAQTTSAGAAGNAVAIAASHLFGVTDAEDEIPVVNTQPDDENLEDSNSNLVLKGTVASAEPEFSVALISTGGTDQDVYVIGDSISSRASLHAVYADRVVLDEGGVLKNLRLPKEYKPVATSSVRRTTTTTRQSPSNSQSIQNVVSQNLTKLTDVIRPTPYMQNGQPAGYRVYPGRDRKQFAALGLRPGDIIKDIDGQSLTEPTQAMKIFQSLGTAEQVTVTIERAGQAETLVLKTDQLDLGGEQTK